MLQRERCTLYSGGLCGTEDAFGQMADKYGVKEVNLTFAGQALCRDKNVTILSEEELKRGDISMDLVSKMMRRSYYESERIRKVLQVIFHMVNNGHQVFAVGAILEDKTVKGGTGWAVELAKFFNRPLHVFDQNTNQWYTWRAGAWHPDSPKIQYETFVGSGTRNLSENGRAAIEQLFQEAFGG